MVVGLDAIIAGKTHSEILSMNRYKRYRWYKTILLEEKEEAMKIVDIAGRVKITGENNPMKRPDIRAKRRGENHPSKRPSVKAKISASMTERWKDPKYIDKHSGKNNSMYGTTRTLSEETITKIRETKIGKKNPSWKGGVSYEPYCPAFDDRRKEHIRNLCDRTCTVCGGSILQYFRMDSKTWARLHIDHTDENKMQGCDDWEWRLTALCPSCHAKMQKQKIPYHLLLQLLLVNNKRHQTNFLFGDEEK